MRPRRPRTNSPTSVTPSGPNANGPANYAPMKSGANESAEANYAPMKTGTDESAEANYAPMKSGADESTEANYAPMKSGADESTEANYAPMKSGADESTEANYAPMKSGVDESTEANYAPMKGGADESAEANYAPMKGGADESAEANYAPMKGDVDESAEANYAPMKSGADESAEANYDPMKVETPEDTKEEVTFVKGNRVSKKSSGRKYTSVISEEGKEYKLVNILDEKASQKLETQNQIYKRGKTILGKGNFGMVRIARLKGTEHYDSQYVAVKKIKKELDIFLMENQFHESVGKKQIDGLMLALDTLLTEDSKGAASIYQFMPLASFGDGKELIRNLAKLEKGDRTTLIRHVSYSLLNTFMNMSANGVYHMDFKPDNFLLNTDGKVYVSDFGSAMVYENGQIQLQPLQQVGDEVKPVLLADLRYTPPEYQSTYDLREELFDKQIDAWRLGLTLLELVCTQPNTKKFFTNYYLQGLKSVKAQPAEAMAYYNSLDKPLERVLKFENVPDDLAHAIRGLLKGNPTERLSVEEAAQLMQAPPAEEQTNVASILTKLKLEERTASRLSDAPPQVQATSPILPRTQTVASHSPRARVHSRASSTVVILTEHMREYMQLVEKLLRYQEKHAERSGVTDKQKAAVAAAIRKLLADTDITHPKQTIVDLKAAIQTAERMELLKHKHFNQVKTTLGIDTTVLSIAKELLQTLEKIDRNKPAPHSIRHHKISPRKTVQEMDRASAVMTDAAPVMSEPMKEEKNRGPSRKR